MHEVVLSAWVDESFPSEVEAVRDRGIREHSRHEYASMIVGRTGIPSVKAAYAKGLN
jgi:hypothetical protein